jgi:hypothetical protein
MLSTEVTTSADDAADVITLSASLVIITVF